MRRAAFVAPAVPAMRRLRDETRETVNIGAPQDGDIVILPQVESREVVREINIVGSRAPLSSSGLGKAILFTLNDAALADHIARHGLPRCTDRSITDPAALVADLHAARARGYATDREEHVPGLHCVAASVFGPSGDAIAAQSISGLAVRLNPARLADAGALVAATAKAMSRDGAAFAVPSPDRLSVSFE